jgi:hypothetical protein
MIYYTKFRFHMVVLFYICTGAFAHKCLHLQMYASKIFISAKCLFDHILKG